MLEETGQPIPFVGFFTSNKIGKTDLTDVKAYVLAPDDTIIVSGAAATPAIYGIYKYILSGDLNTLSGPYLCIFHTDDETVDNKDVAAMWSVGNNWVEKSASVVEILTAIKGDTFTDQTLVEIKAAIDLKLNASSYVIPPPVDNLATLTQLSEAQQNIVTAIPSVEEIRQEIDINSVKLNEIKPILELIKGGTWNGQTLVALKDAIDLKLNSDDYVLPPSVNELVTQTQLSDAQQNIVAAIPPPESIREEIDTNSVKLNDMKLQIDKFIFTDGKVEANATASVDSSVISEALDNSAKLASMNLIINAINGKLSTAKVTVNGEVDSTGTITTTQGDDYLLGQISIDFKDRDLSTALEVKYTIFKHDSSEVLTGDIQLANAGLENQTINFVIPAEKTKLIPEDVILYYIVIAKWANETKHIAGGHWVSRKSFSPRAL